MNENQIKLSPEHFFIVSMIMVSSYTLGLVLLIAEKIRHRNTLGTHIPI